MSESKDEGVLNFLVVDIPLEDMKVALGVIRQFKDCESDEEFLSIPFIAWSKLEQLIEFLAYRVEGAPLKPDTVEALKHEKEQQQQGE